MDNATRAYIMDIWTTAIHEKLRTGDKTRSFQDFARTINEGRWTNEQLDEVSYLFNWDEIMKIWRKQSE